MIIVAARQTALAIEPERELTDEERATVIATYYNGDGFYLYYQEGDPLPDLNVPE
jgi:hypothetical protein